ncbi:P-loop containing nucleoside triphosphate hydrolase protein [Choanephora cucurbitarum]|nr:P-loop containing nucleoside triphosphate hydrolase protein [Choanephora cucurbitarum]
MDLSNDAWFVAKSILLLLSIFGLTVQGLIRKRAALREAHLVADLDILCLARYQYIRLMAETIALMTLVVYQFRQLPNLLHLLINLVTLLYCLILGSIALHCNRMSDPFSWQLNCHLCLVYFVQWISHLFLNQLDLTCLIMALIYADTVYVTSTTKYGYYQLNQNNQEVTDQAKNSIASHLFFLWLTPAINTVLAKGACMKYTDLPFMAINAEKAHSIFCHTRNHPSLFRRLVLANKKAFMIETLLSILSGLVQFGQPVFLSYLLVHMQQMEDWNLALFGEGVFYVAMMALCGFTARLLNAQSTFIGQADIAVSVRSMLNVELYSKSLCSKDISILSDSSDTHQEEKSSRMGQAVNLMSTDAALIAHIFSQWIMFVIAPIQLIAGIYLLYSLLGWSCFVGLCVNIVMMPINSLVTVRFSVAQERLMKVRDERVSLMNELLQGIRQIKFFAWESFWTDRINVSRKAELDQLTNLCVTEAMFLIMWHAVPLFINTAAFWSFTKLQGQELTAPIAFTSIAIFHELEFALAVIPGIIVDWLEMRVSLRRIQSFLEQPEIDTTHRECLTPENNEVGFKNATVIWPTQAAVADASIFKLKDLDVMFPANQLSIICGATGSGKTLMMLSLLNETNIVEGTVQFPYQTVPLNSLDGMFEDSTLPSDWIASNTVAYVSQVAWLQNDSIRNNILFGLPFVPSRYYAVVECCALDKDLAYLDDGDETEIGEKGITLSGGQKARIALARAVYSRASHVLLDDVLSAVDAHTARFLHQQCLTGPLMKYRTVILITHQISLCIQQSAFVVLIKDGGVYLSGSPLEIQQQGKLGLLYNENIETTSQDLDDGLSAANSETNRGRSSVKSDGSQKKTVKALVKEEERQQGTVKLEYYRIYSHVFGSWSFWILFLSSIVIYELLNVASTWWVKRWSEIYASDLSVADNDLNMYLAVYVAINFMIIVMVAIQYTLGFFRGIHASKVIHNQLLQKVFGASLYFFDTTPVGRILNRFSGDLDAIDTQIPFSFTHIFVDWIVVLAVVLVAIITTPLVIGPMILALAGTLYFAKSFVSCSRDLNRMRSVTESPILTQFGETIAGMATIRAFGVKQQFLVEMMKRVDINAHVKFYRFSMNQWFDLRLSMMGSVITFVTGVTIMINLDKMDSGLAGFCLTFVSMFTTLVERGVERYNSLENSFNAVERVVEYMQIEQEAPRITDTRPPVDWPTEGAIEVKQLQVRYASDLPIILKNISFNVHSREKIGIVGRTGSGKSTLALSLFRFIEAAEGRISIDGIDIATLGLEDLRSHLSIIPQDPVLFSGTVRTNLDPFGQYEDNEILMALKRVHLITSQEQLSDYLTQTVAEGGRNFSQGQKQLLCLARALLKKNRILLMDEATASVDFDTDRAIQQSISEEFLESTVICIAHRLNTVIQYDRILVLDHGRIVEFANPLELIENTQTLFHKMCCDSGEFDNLLNLAKSKHQLVDAS